MSDFNVSRGVVWLMAVAALGAIGSAPATAQDSPGEAAAPSPTPTVIHVHHHYYPPLGNDASGGDPAARFTPWMYSGRESAFDALPSFDRNWGDLGLFAYLGEKDDNDGLIVSRVTPNSPAAKLGLVRGDVITEINDVDVGDLSYREIQALFVRLSTTPKIKVNMQVWNVLTGRGETLQSELVNDPPESDAIGGSPSGQ